MTQAPSVSSRRAWLPPVMAYVAAIVISAGLAGLVLEVWKAELAIPLVPRLSGDVLFYEMLVKGMIDNGGYLHNRFLGMPWGQELYDYPIADQLHLFLLKALSLVFRNAGATINVYFLASFPLVAVCALAALRDFGVSYAPALVASVLFSLLPFHFMRGEMHLFLAVYFLVPLVLTVALWISLGRPLAPSVQRYGPRLLFSRGFIALVVVVLSGVGGIYHAFFSAFFLAAAGVIGAFRQGSRRPLLTAAALIAVLFVTVLAALSPSLLYIARHGRNPVAASREQFEAEVFGLKIVHLLLPLSDHRVEPFAKLRRRYDQAHPWPLENENRTAALGLVGGCGFLCLVAHLIFGWPRLRDDEVPSHLSKLAIAAVLLASAGGFSSLVALLISPQLRGYNRISVFVGFLSLSAVAIALDRLTEIWKSRPVLAYGLLGVLLGVGVLDQTTPGFAPRYDTLVDGFHSDREFVQRVEASLPPGAMVFQLPHLSFFEGLPVNGTSGYDPVSLYLQSARLRWSYGAMKGRDADDWQLDMANRPLEEQVERLALIGFAGITVDRAGYADAGAEIERRLAAQLQTSTVESPNRRYVFFDLGNFARTLRSRLDAESWSRRQKAALHPPLIELRGCRDEGQANSSVRDCASGAEVELRNSASTARRVRVEASLAALNDGPLELSLVGSALVSAHVSLGSEPRSLARTIVLPPGSSRVRFVAEGLPGAAGERGDRRRFRVLALHVRDLEE